MRLIKRRPRPPITARATHPLTTGQDSAIGGWLNAKTGEVCPGFTVGSADRVIDVGCGSGGYAHFCASQGAFVTMVDVDGEALARARATFSTIQNAPAPEYHLTDGATLPVASAAVNRVICTEVFEHVEDPKAMMEELVRVGEPGALYLLSCPHPRAEAIFKRIAHPSYFERPNHIRIIDTDEFCALVEGAGLVIESRVNRNFYSLLHWAFFWACPPLSDPPEHPLLDSWAHTWSILLEQPHGALVKQTLDDLLPKSQVIIARKP